MARTHALTESVSANLRNFLQSIDADLTRPQKKFLRDGLVGLRRTGRPVVCRMARKLPDRQATFLARLDRLVYGAADPKAGAVESVFRILDEPRLNHRIQVTSGLGAEACGLILSEFFRARRATDNATGQGDNGHD
jgi:hypothetical protein